MEIQPLLAKEHCMNSWDYIRHCSRP